MVKQLRDKTGAGMMDCKAALTEAGGDMDKAVEILRKKGLASAAKRAGRATKDGIIGHYIHMGGKVGVLVEVNCETDFVARTDDFQTLAKELAMHIAAADPRYVKREDIPAEVLEKEKEIYRAQFAGSGKPANVIDKIVEGKLESYYAQVCLLDQPSVRDPNVTIKQMVAGAAAKTGENVTVSRFARFKLGETAGIGRLGGLRRRALPAVHRHAAPAPTHHARLYNSVACPRPSSAPSYTRILLKLSGEALMGDQTYGIDPAVATRIAAGHRRDPGARRADRRSSSAAATSSAASPPARAAWTARPPTTWACWPR